MLQTPRRGEHTGSPLPPPSPRPWLRPLLSLLCVALAVAGLVRAAGSNPVAPAETTATFITALSQPAAEGFARATQPDSLHFPADFGPHPAYQTEWWYYTGNLHSADGRPFGFQFTLFRRALTPLSPPQSDAGEEGLSAWRTHQVYFAHFALSDITNQVFYHTERYSRGAAGLAGAQAEPYRIWLEAWEVAAQPDGRARLVAAADGYALELYLTPTLPPILHGQGGLSPKSAAPGNASYYYSLVQQQVEGKVTLGDETVAVSGLAWKDHEWSTSVLPPGATGWDWLSLQFSDGAALMLFQIRLADGSLEPASSGSWIAPDGRVTPLRLTEWTLRPTDFWHSPATAARYPIAWELAIPSLDLALTGAAQMPNQELNFPAGAYWEGAVAWEGERAGRPVTAQGYIELTGYADNTNR